MATMNRNINVEEINSDAFMGIPYLNYQTILQKCIFWGCVVAAVAWNILGNFLLHINAAVIVFTTLILVAIGAILGCNYNQDLSIINYLKLIIFKSSAAYISKPTEDFAQIKTAAERMNKETELLEKQKNVTPEQQRKLLIKLLIGALVMVLFFAILLIVLASSNGTVLHHVIKLY